MAAQKKANRGRDLKLKADKLYSGRKWKKALDHYIRAAEHLPGDPRIGQRIGDLYKRLNQNVKAVEEYKRVAKMYATDGFWAKAIAISKLILELDPSDLMVQKELTRMYAKQSEAGKSVMEEKAAMAAPESFEHPQAISIAEETPRTMDDPQQDVMLGNTVSIAGQKPRTMEKPTAEEFNDAYDPNTIDFGQAVTAVHEVPLGNPVAQNTSIPLFSEMSPEELFAVMERLAVRRFPPQALVCEEGDVGSSMYVISEGVLEVFTKDSSGQRLALAQLQGGDFFGEYGLLTNGERNASVQATTEVELLEIGSSDLDVIAAKHPRVWNVLEHYLQKRMIDTIFRKSDVFRLLSEDERKKLASFLKPMRARMNIVVMSEGTPGEEMYFVKSGTLVVSIAQQGKRVVVGELGPGDYFGEVAMLTGQNRTATVQAKLDCELYRLGRTEAASVLKNNRAVLMKLKNKMQERKEETASAYQAFMEARTTLEFV